MPCPVHLLPIRKLAGASHCIQQGCREPSLIWSPMILLKDVITNAEYIWLVRKRTAKISCQLHLLVIYLFLLLFKNTIKSADFRSVLSLHFYGREQEILTRRRIFSDILSANQERYFLRPWAKGGFQKVEGLIAGGYLFLNFSSAPPSSRYRSTSVQVFARPYSKRTPVERSA